MLYTTCSQERLDQYDNLTQLAKSFTEIDAMKQNSMKIKDENIKIVYE